MATPSEVFSEFAVTTKVIAGVGSLSALPAELRRLQAHRIAIVADQGVADAGLLDLVAQQIDSTAVKATILVAPDPDVAAAEAAAHTARWAGCDSVLAVGGGSALGAAKAVAIRLTNERTIDAYVGTDRVERRPAPTIAIPTTAGSGSEVSKVLVLHEAGRTNELVVRVNGGEPKVAILDATVLRGLPRAPMLYAGLDALTHSLESQWARGGSTFTKWLANGAAGAIIDTLPVAVAGTEDDSNRRGDNDGALQQLLEASCAANMACGNSGLTLVHALSSAPTVHLPHGYQNGVLLPHVARFNYPVSDEATRELVDRLDGLYRKLGFQAQFLTGQLGADGRSAMLTACKNNPLRSNNQRDATDEDLLDIIARADS